MIWKRAQQKLDGFKKFIDDPFGIGDGLAEAVGKALADTYNEIWDAYESPGPARIRWTGVYARLHSRQWGTPDKFHTLFVDTEGKRNARERFAEPLPGHFFSATVAGARAEAAYYNVQTRSRFLLEVELELPDVFDLTKYDVMLSEYQRTWARSRIHLCHRFALSVDQSAGGNPLTDDVGIDAFLDRYRGIQFFSVRALTDDHMTEIVTTKEDLYTNHAGKFCNRLRGEPDIQNLVVFTAGNVVRHTKAYRVNGKKWRPNPRSGLDDDSLEEVYHNEGLPTPMYPSRKLLSTGTAAWGRKGNLQELLTEKLNGANSIKALAD